MSNPKVTEPPGADTTKMHRYSRFLYAAAFAPPQAGLSTESLQDEQSARKSVLYAIYPSRLLDLHLAGFEGGGDDMLITAFDGSGECIVFR